MTIFPVTPDEITADWLTRVLGCTVNSFTAEPLGEGGGLLGLVTRLHLESAGGPATLIAKFPTQTPENRAVADVYDMYGREYRFYKQVAPGVPMRSPACHHAEFNPENSNFVLLLEDLQGYRLGDQIAGCNHIEAHQIVEGIASLHRNTWQPDHLTEILRHDMPFQRQGMITGFQAGWPVVLERFPQFFDDDLIRIAGTMPEQVDRLLDSICEGPLVIAHGDVRLDNMFFADSEVAFVDFQAVCKAAPEHDLAYFVTQSLPDEVRNAEDWLTVYHNHLTVEGIEYDIDKSRERYRLCAMYFFCYFFIIAGTLYPATERGRVVVETIIGY